MMIYEMLMKKRNYIRDGVGHLTAPNGEVWVVDADDFRKCKDFLWSRTSNGKYAFSRKTGLLHRYLNPKWKIVDHIDGDPKNNRRANLRNGGNGIQGLNKRLNIVSCSGSRGIHRMREKWQVRITVNKERHYLGTFNDIPAARSALCKWVSKRGLMEFYSVA